MTFNPPELRRLRAHLRRHYGARGSFREQVEVARTRLSPTSGGELVMLERTHHNLALERVGVGSPGDFREACTQFTTELGAATEPPVALRLISWALLLGGVGVMVSGVDAGSWNPSTSFLPLLFWGLAVGTFGPLFGSGGGLNLVVGSLCLVLPVAFLGANASLDGAFWLGLLIVQLGLLCSPLRSGIRRSLLLGLVGLELLLMALYGYYLFSPDPYAFSVVVMAVLGLLVGVSVTRLTRSVA